MNDLQIKALKPKEKKYTVSDKGIVISVYPTGVKTLSYIVTEKGKRKMVLVGEYPQVSFKAALDIKNKSIESRKEIRELNRVVSTKFKDVTDRWLQMKIDNQIADRTLISIRTTLKHLEVFNDFDVSEIKPLIVTHKLADLKDRPTTVRQAYSRLNEILNFAVNNGLLEFNPCANLVKTLSKYRGGHIRSVHYSGIKALSPVLKGRYRNVFMLLVLTLLRPNEVIQLKWDYMDYDANVITVPADIMKMKREHRVPITPQLKSVLQGIPKETDYILPDSKKTGHFCKRLLNFMLKDCPIAPHGFRSMARTYFAENNVRFEVAESCLAHQEQSAVVRAYSRTDYLEERREVMQKWSDYVFEQLEIEKPSHE